jgi:hypothetical protein
MRVSPWAGTRARQTLHCRILLRSRPSADWNLFGTGRRRDGRTVSQAPDVTDATPVAEYERSQTASICEQLR